MFNTWLYVCSLIILTCVKSSLVFSCGVRRILMQQLIVRGHDTAPGEWPWHVAIYKSYGKTSKYVCGGTLVSEQFVITAAHCVQQSNVRVFVRLGVHNKDALNEDTLQEHAVEIIHIPSKNTSKNFKNDIAILELATFAQFNDYVQPACLSSTRDLTGHFGTVVGWGVTEDDEVSSILKSARMPVIDPIKCLASNRPLFGNSLDEGMLCAGYTNGTSVCNGDSGGGIFFNKDNVWYLGGIVSFTAYRSLINRRCHTKGYAAFTRVYTYLPWISSVIKQLPTDDPRGSIFERCQRRTAEPNGTYANLLPRLCGDYLSNRIINGQTAKVFEFPWIAILNYMIENTYYNLCAGTLINRRYVLTAAHCVKRSRYPIEVILGEHTVGRDRDCNELDGERECAPPVQKYGIECIIPHQNYSRRTRENDIALVRLDGNVIFDDHILPVCLPVISSLRKLSLPRYIVTGWRKIKYADLNSEVLFKATVTSANRSSCQHWMSKACLQLYDSQLCVGGADGAGTCRGDCGGPLGYLANYYGMRFVQFGITSVAPVVCGFEPAVYTKVASFIEWIMANMDP